MSRTSSGRSPDRYERRLRRRGCLIRWGLFTILFLVGTALLINWLFLTRGQLAVPDQSMFPSVEGGSTVLFRKGGIPSPGDVVLIGLDGHPAIRRVIATGGSTVEQTEAGLIVDGQVLERDAGDEVVYLVREADRRAVREQDCQMAVEHIGAREVRVCVDRRSERDREPIELAEEEIYVRCDNRAFCARREGSEGLARLEDLEGIALFLMSTRDDSDQPFYKRWFGRFESLP